MGAAYYPVFEKQVKGVDPATAVSGKSLAKVMEVLDECARQIGVQPLSGFYSESVEESFELIGEEVPADAHPTHIQWFSPDEGLESIRRLTEHLAAHPEALEAAPSQDKPGRKKSAADMLADFEALAASMTNTNPRVASRASGSSPPAKAVLADLAALARVLETAQENGTRFRLGIDI